MVNLIWHFRREQIAAPPPGRTIDSRIEQFREAKRNGMVPHSRTRRNQDQDGLRLERRQERRRLFKEGRHFKGGEVVALTDSDPLDILRADVLQDPNIRTPGGYIHPHLKEVVKMAWDDGLPLLLSRKGRYGFFPKLSKPTPQPHCKLCTPAERRIIKPTSKSHTSHIQ